MEDGVATSALAAETQLLLRRHTETAVKLHVGDGRVRLEGASVAEANLTSKEAGNGLTAGDTQPVTESHEEQFRETTPNVNSCTRPPGEPQHHPSQPSFLSRLRTFFLGWATHGDDQVSAKRNENRTVKRKAGETGTELLAPNASCGPATPSKRHRLSESEAVIGIPQVHLEGTCGAEVYHPSDLAKLGSCQEPWDLGATRTQTDAHKARCHQCGRKVSRHSVCSQCQRPEGRVCGDCLYMRYGENLNEVDRNPQWVCPVCRGICNCLFCRMDRGWPCFTPSYEAAKAKGFPSVAHYLITAKQASVVTSPHGREAFDALMDNAPSTTNLAPVAHVPSTVGHSAASAKPCNSELQPITPAPAPGTVGNAITPFPVPSMKMEGVPGTPASMEGAFGRTGTTGMVSEFAVHMTAMSPATAPVTGTSGVESLGGNKTAEELADAPTPLAPVNAPAAVLMGTCATAASGTLSMPASVASAAPISAPVALTATVPAPSAPATTLCVPVETAAPNTAPEVSAGAASILFGRASEASRPQVPVSPSSGLVAPSQPPSGADAVGPAPAATLRVTSAPAAPVEPMSPPSTPVTTTFAAAVTPLAPVAPTGTTPGSVMAIPDRAAVVAPTTAPAASVVPAPAPVTPVTMMPDPVASMPPTFDSSAPVVREPVPATPVVPCPSPSNFSTQSSEAPSIPCAGTSAPEVPEQKGCTEGVAGCITGRPMAPSPAAIGPRDLDLRPFAEVPGPTSGTMPGAPATGVAEPNAAELDMMGHGTAGPGAAAQGGIQGKGTGTGDQHEGQPVHQEMEDSEALPRGTPQLGSPLETESEAQRTGNVCSQPTATAAREGGFHCPMEDGAEFMGDVWKAADDAIPKSDFRNPGGGHRTSSPAGHGIAADAGNAGRKQAGNRQRVLEITRFKRTYLRVETLQETEAASPTEVPHTASRKRARDLEREFQAAGPGATDRAAVHSKEEEGGVGKVGGRVRAKLSEAAKLLQTNLRSGRAEEAKGADPAVKRPPGSKNEQQGSESEKKQAKPRLAAHKEGARSLSKGTEMHAPHGTGVPKPSQTKKCDGKGDKAGRGRRTVQAGTYDRAGGTRNPAKGRVRHSASEVARLYPTLLRVERLEEPKGIVPTVRVTRSMCTGPRYVGPGQRRQETDMQDGHSHELQDTAACRAAHGHSHQEEGVGQSGDSANILAQTRGQQGAQEDFCVPKATGKRLERMGHKELVRLAPTLLRVDTLEGPRSGNPVGRMTRGKGAAPGHAVAMQGTSRPDHDPGHARGMQSDVAARGQGRRCNEELSDCGSKAEYIGSTVGGGEGSSGKEEL